MHRILQNFQLSPQFCSLGCNSSAFPPRKPPAFHATTTTSPSNTPKYCTVLFTGPRRRNGSLSTLSHPTEQKLMELEPGRHKEMEKQGTDKGKTAPAVHRAWSAGLWTAPRGTGHQCHWLSKSKNRTILRQVPKQGAIYFLGTISSDASRLLFYPLYCQ